MLCVVRDMNVAPKHNRRIRSQKLDRERRDNLDSQGQMLVERLDDMLEQQDEMRNILEQQEAALAKQARQASPRIF